MIYTKLDSEKIKDITNLFNTTFTQSENKSEGKLIGELSDNLINNTNKNDIHVYLAKDEKKIVGCVIFSKLKFERSNKIVFILSPIAIHPDYQKKRIGQNLINFGHKEIKKFGIEYVVTYGDIKFYEKVGYKKISEEMIPSPYKLSYPDGWLSQSLIGEEIESIEGKSYCVEALDREEYW